VIASVTPHQNTTYVTRADAIFEQEAMPPGRQVAACMNSFGIDLPAVRAAARPDCMWTPDLVRKEARVQLGTVARGDNPAVESQT
jgi:hypothetical protein